MHPNPCLDWWAWKQTGDRTFVDGARRHLDASLEAFVNGDESTNEFGDFDVETGKMVRHFAILGSDDDSCWQRGQAWAISGCMRACEELDDLRYLVVGRKLLECW